MAAHAGGGTTVGRRNKFFKVLLPGSFEGSLRIPPKFSAGLACRHRRATATLRDPAGRLWGVDLDHRGVSFSGQGWRGFVSANGVSTGHLLVFEQLGELDFAVDLFDASGCLSELVFPGGRRDNASSSACGDDVHVIEIETTADTTDDKESGNKRRRTEPAGVLKRTKPSLSTATIGSCEEEEDDARGLQQQCDDETLLRLRIEKPYQLRLLDLSKSLCERVGWTASRDVELCAAGDERRRWPVSVKVSAKGGMLCAGWKAFVQDNGLRLWDACVLVVPCQASHDVIRVRILRGATPTP